ncbi:MAG: protein kinase [Phycisphaerales bacterium]|nr:protein kinase [Phycisphaerales bacterium]
MTTITSFNLKPGRMLARNYRVEGLLGAGWQGEVYLFTEAMTGVRRAAKMFFPHRNENDCAVRFYARKLEKLRHCALVIQYVHTEVVRLSGHEVTVLISEYAEGTLLSKFIEQQPGKRMPVFEALSLLRTLAFGLAEVHACREYHGDLHVGNILVGRRGIHWDVRVVDVYDHGRPSLANIRNDVCDLIRCFYDMLGGARVYAKLPVEVRSICCGLKRSLIEKRFPSAAELCHHLDTFEWSAPKPRGRSGRRAGG